MMSKPDPIAIQETFDTKEAEFIQEKLNQYNLLFAPPDHHRALVLLARDQKEIIVGGLVGITYWCWLHIDILWVAESLRQQGIGQQLLQKAEEQAVKRGCLSSHLETHTFQALGFYEKHGYQVFGELPDLPSGYTKYFLKKNLGMEKGNKKEKIVGTPKE
jgi:ribosomal protein S18 acetylase RimI-like enzyme